MVVEAFAKPQRVTHSRNVSTLPRYITWGKQTTNGSHTRHHGVIDIALPRCWRVIAIPPT
jgi:hypothetical protein